MKVWWNMLGPGKGKAIGMHWKGQLQNETKLNSLL